MRSRRAIGILALSLLLLTAVATGAGALSASRGCTTPSGNEAATNRFTYDVYSSTRFIVRNIYYTMSPRDDASTHNNVNYYYYGGSNSLNWNSPDNLIRDGVEHLLHGANYLAYRDGRAYFRFTNIIDIPWLGDPSCQTTVYVPRG